MPASFSMYLGRPVNARLPLGPAQISRALNIMPEPRMRHWKVHSRPEYVLSWILRFFATLSESQLVKNGPNCFPFTQKILAAFVGVVILEVFQEEEKWFFRLELGNWKLIDLKCIQYFKPFYLLDNYRIGSRKGNTASNGWAQRRVIDSLS